MGSSRELPRDVTSLLHVTSTQESDSEVAEDDHAAIRQAIAKPGECIVCRGDQLRPPQLAVHREGQRIHPVGGHEADPSLLTGVVREVVGELRAF
ncbi:hypothetical protein ABT117_25020 [Streptomyces sp. NPDC002262]|uniref:hypothetical protein n=1 Tax=Streptomyces sp. NPDC002262 TaxID=3154414 RepID=UPI00331FDBC0